MSNHQIIIALGSNEEAASQIEKACRHIEQLLPHVHWSTPVYTRPVCSICTKLFLNRIGLSSTFLTIEELRYQFKRIEKELGRTANSKYQGIIPIDIDLLQWNDQILKPKDMLLDYIQNGIQEIKKETSGSTNR